VRRLYTVGGGAPVNVGQWRRAASPKKLAAATALRNQFYAQVHE